MYLVAALVRLLSERLRRVVVVVPVVLVVFVVVLDETANGQQRQRARTHAHTHDPYVGVSAETHPRLDRWSIYLALRGRPFAFVPGYTASVRY